MCNWLVENRIGGWCCWSFGVDAGLDGARRGWDEGAGGCGLGAWENDRLGVLDGWLGVICV